MELRSPPSSATIVPLTSPISSLQPNTRSLPYTRLPSRVRTLWPPSLVKTTSGLNSTRSYCQKMYVPGFGESPEGKAANYLVSFFTYVAVEVVASQLQSYNPEGYVELMEFVNTHPLKDGDEFCASLMRQSSRHQAFALRILEVRSAYSKMDFEWDNLKRLALKKVGDSNTRLMRDYVLETTNDSSDK